MTLSWNEIRDRAVKFSKEWDDTVNEDAEAKSFLEAFFDVFGLSRKKVATFEHRVKKLDDHDGYIDLLWKGTFLVEMKSRGKDLNKAYQQAREYLQGLSDFEIPKYVLVSDFEFFKLYDLEEDTTVSFKLKDFVKNVQHFGFIAGYYKHTYKEQDPVNIKAAVLMGKLHDKLKAVGYEGHPLELYLVRILFCLFADDTTIFDKDIFHDFIENRTGEDGSDLAARLSELFYILNTHPDKRLKNLDENLKAFPYVNGKLFEESLPPASFDTSMRNILLECCTLDWGKISPAIFGSMFQSVKNPLERRNLGAHYTSEKNILKLIKPLFLDDLWKEFESIKNNRTKLIDFHYKISIMKFLDPACGCGNFLVVTYRELRLLELEILRCLYTKGKSFLQISDFTLLDVDMMYGIELDEFPARIAEVAMWLIDHQMNMAVSSEFGQYFARLPLRKAANIVIGNALTLNWEKIVPKEQLSYILGNPPFIGKHLQDDDQKKDLGLIFANTKGTGVLDYVTAWYVKAAQYIYDTVIKVAFVSTNSISQGEQVGLLWNLLFNRYNIKIHFAHRTFRWNNEAKGNAAVHVVIIGFANYDVDEKRIFEYEDIKGEPHEIKVKNINPYLVEGKDFALISRSEPICKVPVMQWGNKPVDGGNLILSEEEMKTLITSEPKIKPYIRELLSAKEFLSNIKRYCIWLVDISPNQIKEMPLVYQRVQLVKEMREKSIDKGANMLALFPQTFRDKRNPSSYILIPSTTSINRKYIPMGFFGKEHIAHNSCHMLADGKLYDFGVLMSFMHMIWVLNICGRLKSDYRYSNDLVYNNFPWPENPTEKQVKAIEECAQKVLDVRTEFPDSSLADLYDPLTMPPALVKAHNNLDKAVDQAYRSAPFATEAKRMEFLFELYEKYTAELFTKEKPKKVKKKKE